MSEGYARLELTKGNKMNKNELLEAVEEIQTAELVELVGIKTGFDTLGSYAYALSLFWHLSDNKLKAKIVKMIDEETN
jgi:predicted amino acid racemase